MKKRLLALLLCLSMLLSFTVSTYAEGNGDLSSHGYYDDFENVAGSGGNTNTDGNTNTNTNGNTNTDGDTSTGGDTTEIPVVPDPVVPEESAPVKPGFDDENLPGVTVCEECGAANGHAETCSQYVAPEDESDAKHEYYKLDKVAGACEECGEVDGHLESCSQYVAEFSVEAFYAQVMSAGSVDEIDALFAALTDEELALVESTLTEEQIAALSAYVEELEALEAANAFVRPVDVTNAAPFLPPVVGEEELVMDVPMVYNMRTLMASASANSYAVMPLADEDSSSSTTTRVDNDDVVTTKTATMNDDGKATIRLETYVTGSKVTTAVSEEVPTDIVLVLDQSGSMDFCIKCGKKNTTTHTVTTYTETYTINASGTYYYKDSNGEYQRVYYCQGASGDSSCEGGWFTSPHYGPYWEYHDYGTEWTPKESATDDSGTQFYTRVDTTEACESRLDALKDAVDGFIDDVVVKAKGKDGKFGNDENGKCDDIKHRVAIVGFASGIYQAESWEQSNTYGENTELLSIRETGSTSVGKDYYVKSGNSYIGNLGTEDYKKVLQEVTDATGRDILYGAKDALDASGATRADLGLEMAMKVFENNPLTGTEKRNRVVIFFTDGQPTGYDGFDTDVADDAIGYAKTLKAEAVDTDKDGTVDGYGATVYSVGVFSGADGTTPAPDYDDDKNNRFMHYVSSNYPEATKVNDSDATINPDLEKDESYYLSAGDSDALNNIFEKISDQIESGGASITLNSSTVVQDVMSQYFTLPAGTKAEDIEVYTADYTETGWGEDTAYNATVTVTPETATQAAKVSVTNFDFSANYVGYDTAADGTKTARGKKLIIVFEAEPKDGFWGGNGVPTNDSSSGVYNSEKTLVENFEEPKVDVPIHIPAPTPVDRNIYFGGTTPETTDLYKGITPEEEWQDDYIKSISYSMNGTVGNTADGTYTITATAEPLYEGTYPNDDNPGTSTCKSDVAVFKPVATFHDSTYYLGQKPTDYVTENLTSLVWKHGDTLSTAVTMFDDEIPAVTYTFNPTVAGATFQDCTPVAGSIATVGGLTYTDAKPGTFTVHILKPHVAVTLADTTRYYGEEYKATGGSSTVSWTDDNTAHTVIPPATGKAPYDSATLKYYSDKEKTKEFSSIVMPDADVKVYVKAFNGNTELPATFKTTCTEAGHNCTEHYDGYYIVHPDFCELTINKTVTNAYDANDTFLFNVVGKNSTYPVNMDVVIQGSGSVTIGHLPVGQYTVTEDETWSWRYTVSGANGTSETLSSGSPSQTWAITNTLGGGNKDKWLTDSSSVTNVWSDNNTTVGKKKDQ